MNFNMKFCLLISVSCILLNYVNCTEFVPVYMWTTQTKIANHVPALHKISGDSFKEFILDYSKTDPYVVVFTEQTLSPEDFAQRDQNGDTIYRNLLNLKQTTTTSYLPYVQNPIKSLKHLNKNYIEQDIEKFVNDIPENNILFINLNDAEDNEDRIDMLKRHDSTIVSIFDKISEKYKNVIALYTAHHTSWVASEDFSNSRKVRSLLADDPKPAAITCSTSDNGKIVFYASAITIDNSTSSATVTCEKDGTSGYIVKSSDFFLNFTSTKSGYWRLSTAQVKGEDVKVSADFAAPLRFSWHCTDQVFKTTKTETKPAQVLLLKDFQVQPDFDGRGNKTRFGDSYDCIGFTSVPIWSGIFITFILLFILTAGITMMIDIKTMDRFDDPKGKTITISASE